MTEGRALLIAGTAHVVLLAALSLGLTAVPKIVPSTPSAVPVEIVDVSDAPSAPAPRTEAPAPSPTPAALEPLPTPAPPEATPPLPTPALPPPKPEPAPKPAPAPAPKPTPTAVPGSAPKQAERLDTRALANLLDRSIPKAAPAARAERGATAPVAAPARARDSSAFARSIEQGLAKGAGNRLDARATAALEQAIRAQIAPCWNPPVGGKDVEQMTVVLRIRLNKDGSVASAPELVSQTGATAGNAAYARAFADTARRAVLRCQPLKLPPDLFDAWREFELNFDPKLLT